MSAAATASRILIDKGELDSCESTSSHEHLGILHANRWQKELKPERRLIAAGCNEMNASRLHLEVKPEVVAAPYLKQTPNSPW